MKKAVNVLASVRQTGTAESQSCKGSFGVRDGYSRIGMHFRNTGILHVMYQNSLISYIQETILWICVTDRRRLQRAYSAKWTVRVQLRSGMNGK